MTQLIERAAVEQVFGSTVNLDKQIAEFKDALKAHAKSKNTPAPTAHGVVEVIVRNHKGKYQVVEPQVQEFHDVAKDWKPAEVQRSAPIELTFEQEKEQRLSDLSDLRHTRQMEGIQYKGRPFAGDPLTLNALMAAFVSSQDEVNVVLNWKDADGGFLEIEKPDIVALIKAVRELTQACFNNEARLSRMLKAVGDSRSLQKVNITTGWPE
jgi:hypothetical protein